MRDRTERLFTSGNRPSALSAIFIGLGLFAGSCNSSTSSTSEASAAEYGSDTVQTAVGSLILPAPYATESVENRSELVGWPDGETPDAPPGFTVTRFADDLQHPRWSYVAPNNDIFVSESDDDGGANRITLLRDTDGDGQVDMQETFIDGLNQPFGMLVVGNTFYVANTDGLYKFPYEEGQTSIDKDLGEKIVSLPAGGYNHHWTRNVITNEAKDKLYIAVGSASNVGEYGMEEEERRANILVTDLDGNNEIIYASGLRNPVGIDWNPANGQLWAAVNERDKLGNNLVPDYITSVQKGGFYGWPYSYYGQIVDPRRAGEAPGLVERAIIPDVSVGPHTASLGLVFYDAEQFPAQYRNGAFVGQHGSWNRANLSGYKVVFVPFENGKPTGEPQDFLTGFMADESDSEVYGRPVCVAITPQGDLLVNDDDGNVIWKVSYTGE
ncbi:sorbosone dehydrogenase family protein [Roseivirga sp. BDSF3-8]|uniref:PQQ-dependent sugar dehydrogenase n=1 Tax=Roseivirga sp. BDSF3-8 TaxID=3241598 RepID=UPI0035323BEC